MNPFGNRFCLVEGVGRQQSFKGGLRPLHHKLFLEKGFCIERIPDEIGKVILEIFSGNPGGRLPVEINGAHGGRLIIIVGSGAIFVILHTHGKRQNHGRTLCNGVAGTQIVGIINHPDGAEGTGDDDDRRQYGSEPVFLHGDQGKTDEKCDEDDPGRNANHKG